MSTNTQLAAFDAAIAAELPRVSHVEYDSHEICKHFAGKVRERLLAAHDAEQSAQAVPAGFKLVPVEFIEAGQRIAQDYARTNPKWLMWDNGEAEPKVQDPCGAHAWLERAAMLAAAPTPPAPEAKSCHITGTCKHGSWCSEVYCQEHCQFVEAQAAPEAQQPAGQEQDERAAFEAWAISYSTIPLKRDDDASLGFTGYTEMDQTMLWDAWQAAMAHAREAVESVPVPRTWDFATSRHSWVTSQDFGDYRASIMRALGEQ